MVHLPTHVPAEFERMFVERGRLACEAHFGAARMMVDAWMRKCGKERLIEARAAYVAKQRANGEWMTRATPLVKHREIARPSARASIRDKRKVSAVVARHAAQHLRIRRNGGFIVSPSADGDWWVGTKRMSAAQMVDFAKAKGFDDQAVALTGLQPPSAVDVKS